jgi:hypothetical protein
MGHGAGPNKLDRLRSPQLTSQREARDNRGLFVWVLTQAASSGGFFYLQGSHHALGYWRI